MSNNRATRTDTFRLAFATRKISELFKNPTVKAVLLAELRERGPDAKMIIKMFDKAQPVRPVQLSRQQQAASVNAAQPFDATNNVQDPPLKTPGW